MDSSPAPILCADGPPEGEDRSRYADQVYLVDVD
jgi:hypothetical protein